MTSRERILLTAITCCLLLMQASSLFAANSAEINAADGVTSVKMNGKDVLLYKYADVPFKPYIKQLYSPAGAPILLDAPTDHQHHHALMYAITVDGVNFWEEATAPGRQSHVSIWDVIAVSDNDGSTARFKETLDWDNPRTEELLIKEQREIRVCQGVVPKATLLTWQSTFTLPEGKDSATLTGSHYHGLGMRFVRSMDNGTFFNADGKEGKVYRGSERLLRSRWCAYTAKVDGKPVTVAMFDDPANARHPATWFTMDDPFAYISATLNMHVEPLKLAAGKPLALRYGLALWDGEIDKQTIEKACKDWIALKDDK